jgi:nucleoside-diphosphate-sugar epimerase
MRVLVTGGAGFVGRHVIKRLLLDGHEVVCVDSLLDKTGCIHPTEWTEINPFDFKKFSFLNMDCRKFFSEDNEYFDEIFHLAAMVGGRMMIEYNPLAVAEDLSIDASMFVWAKKTRVGKILNFSSSAAYPVALQTQSNYRLLVEDDICFSGSTVGIPDLSYGWAKLTAEFLGKIAFERHGIKSVVYRPFSGYGETQDLSYPFPSIIKRVFELESNANKTIVWGSGQQMRDFIHIDDCVTCIMQTKDRINDGSPLNISTGILTSFIDFTKVALKVLGRDSVEVLGQSSQPEGVFARGGDIKKQIALGFSPEITLEVGIERALSSRVHSSN